jgi:4-hydroxybenzoate polyprenyltransferase
MEPSGIHRFAAREMLARVIPASWMPYVLHLRPRAMGIVIGHMSAGFLLSNGLDFGSDRLVRWVLAALAWGALGSGGTLSLNSAFDKDEGDIGYLDAPPSVPRHLASFALILMLLGIPIALMLGWRFSVVYGICLAMSLLYSVPPFRFKARAGLDVLINATGYGGLTIYAGWAATGQPLRPPVINVVVAFFWFFVGFYPLTQIYQMAEDAERGDYTLALALGKQNALCLAILAVGVGFTFLALEVLQRHQTGRSVGLMLALLAWGAVLIPWYLRHRQADVTYEKQGFYRALYAWALTDIAVVVAMMPAI